MADETVLDKHVCAQVATLDFPTDLVRYDQENYPA